MKILKIISIVLILSITGNTFASSNFLGMQKSKTAQVLDNFNNYQQELLFENVPITNNEEEGLFDTESKMNSLKSLLDRINDSKNQMKDKKRAITRKKITLKNTIKELDNGIEETTDEIRKIEQEISLKNQKISEFTSKIKDIDSKITVNKKAILEYLSYIYSKGDLVYSEDNNLDVVKSIVLNDGNISDIINDIHFKTLIELSGQNLIDAHRNLIKEFYYNKEQLKKEKLDNLKLKSELVARNKDLESQKEYKQNLLDITRGQEALFNNFILAKQQREDDIKSKIDELDSNYYEVYNNIGKKYNCDINFNSGSVSENQDIDINDSPKCKEIKKYFTLEKRLRDSTTTDFNSSNPLKWPASPINGLSTYFHEEYYYNQLGSQHEAIDVPLPQGTNLSAPAAGYVYLIKAPTQGSYGYVALKHAGGFITVYGHISELLVNRFDFVEAGMIFAKSGGAIGTPGAGPMTSGPHLHFEVYKDRNHVDPLAYLDVTSLNFDDLPVKYRYKYVDDLKIKYGSKVNMNKFKKFYIAGETEIDRQKYMLNKYASADFNNWDMWIEEGVSAKIDPSFLICVGLAESGLGRNLKTAYNVGNIGNTDSGSTYEFANPREGIYWMTKTLNNRFLGKYKTIDKLSRWGNKTGAIYASSSKNWHNNVTRCLSSLKSRYVEDNFEFRLTSSN